MEIILAPACSGKTFFISENKGKYNNISLICGEYYSTVDFYKKGIRMGGVAPRVPVSHPLYASWEEIYKHGIEKFYNTPTKNTCLIFNSGKLIPWIKANFWEINLKIVLLDEETHLSLYYKKWEKDELTQKPLIELIKNHQEYVSKLGNYLGWEYIKEERIHYKRISEIFNIPVYKSFELALS